MMNVFFRPFLKVFSLITFTRFFLFPLLPLLMFMPSVLSSFRRRVDFAIVPSQPWCRFSWTLHTLTGNQRRAISVVLTTYILFFSTGFTDLRFLGDLRGVIRSVSLAMKYRSVAELGASHSASFSPDCTVYVIFHLDNVVGRRLSPATLDDVWQIFGRLLHKTVWIGDFPWASWLSIAFLVHCHVRGLFLRQ